MKVGDVIAFGGKSYVSRIIKFFTKSKISHVGIISRDDEITESTTLDGYSGVIKLPLLRRLQTYKGKVWIYSLRNEYREKFDYLKFKSFLDSHEGKDYDTKGAILSGIDWFDKIFGFTFSRENFDKLYCSELAAGALEAAGVLENINCSEMTPADLCDLYIFKEPSTFFV